MLRAAQAQKADTVVHPMQGILPKLEVLQGGAGSSLSIHPGITLLSTDEVLHSR